MQEWCSEAKLLLLSMDSINHRGPHAPGPRLKLQNAYSILCYRNRCHSAITIQSADDQCPESVELPSCSQ
uniref:Ovule protein n=1 Tax=Panagrellus redivivus TaxID=6233 RepID=A0A7E4VFR3_PANRE